MIELRKRGIEPAPYYLRLGGEASVLSHGALPGMERAQIAVLVTAQATGTQLATMVNALVSSAHAPSLLWVLWLVPFGAPQLRDGCERVAARLLKAGGSP